MNIAQNWRICDQLCRWLFSRELWEALCKENSAFIVLLCSVPWILHLQFCWCFWLLQYHSKMNEPSKKGRYTDNIYGIAGRCLPMRTNTEYCQSIRIPNITFHKVIHWNRNWWQRSRLLCCFIHWFYINPQLHAITHTRCRWAKQKVWNKTEGRKCKKWNFLSMNTNKQNQQSLPVILFDLLAHPCGYVRGVRLLQQLFCFCIKRNRASEYLLPAM